jgi:hypothetical protein
MTQFNIEFQKYFNNASLFKKQLIMWGALTNPQCTDQFYKDFIDTMNDDYDIYLADDTYKGYKTSENIKLQSIDEHSLNKLNDYFKRLDGTLLTDLVYKFLETHKIF